MGLLTFLDKQFRGYLNVNKIIRLWKVNRIFLSSQHCFCLLQKCNIPRTPPAGREATRQSEFRLRNTMSGQPKTTSALSSAALLETDFPTPPPPPDDEPPPLKPRNSSKDSKTKRCGRHRTENTEGIFHLKKTKSSDPLTQTTAWETASVRSVNPINSC